ncbi:transporter [Paucibacter sp. APW11]|uniref:Transporter n=1 Tax=Roseateles aquae TaxID=3077235 RepID=A0ABU3PEQ9_9BURK|nr:transporter [Paucibacter sp. APW11]MDT9000583.1 transporter [Paucibacter sp. APW11]
MTAAAPRPAPPTSYGADEQGLICGYRFIDGAAGVEIDCAASLDSLASASGGNGFVWLHFNLAHAGALSWLHRHSELSEDFYQALREGSRSTRISRDGAAALQAVINDVTFDFSFDPEDVATLWLHLSERLVISARHHPLRSVDRLRAAVKRGDALPTPVALLEHLLSDQADELQHIVRSASDRIDDIEDEILARRQASHSAELARLRRLSVRLQRLLAPEPGALLRVMANPPGWVGAEDKERLRRVNEEFAVVLRDIASLQERIKLLQEEASAQVAEQNNRSLFILTMVTVMALPINLVAGLLGMNVGGIPLNEHPHGFWLVLLLILGFTGLLAWLAMRRLAPRRA